jgi:hypothetical protein
LEIVRSHRLVGAAAEHPVHRLTDLFSVVVDVPGRQARPLAISPGTQFGHELNDSPTHHLNLVAVHADTVFLRLAKAACLAASKSKGADGSGACGGVSEGTPEAFGDALAALAFRYSARWRSLSGSRRCHAADASAADRAGGSWLANDFPAVWRRAGAFPAGARRPGGIGGGSSRPAFTGRIEVFSSWPVPAAEWPPASPAGRPASADAAGVPIPSASPAGVLFVLKSLCMALPG